MHPNDGFDLLEYPCRYTFKAVCRNQAASIEAAKNVFSESIRNNGKPSADNNRVSFDINPSGKGKYVSVSATLTLLNRTDLELIYQRLHEHELVLMAL